MTSPLPEPSEVRYSRTERLAIEFDGLEIDYQPRHTQRPSVAVGLVFGFIRENDDPWEVSIIRVNHRLRLKSGELGAALMHDHHYGFPSLPWSLTPYASRAKAIFTERTGQVLP